MKLTVQKDAAAQRMGHTTWSQAKLGQGVVKPGLNDIADLLIKDLQGVFGTRVHYLGDMQRGFDKRPLSATSVGITQSAAHELFIRDGTAGPYKGFPAPVVSWAIHKGHSRSVAFAIAKKIQRDGTADSFKSLYPAGQRRFDYPAWVVEKRKNDLDKWARAIGGATVRWITTGAGYTTRSLG